MVDFDLLEKAKKAREQAAAAAAKAAEVASGASSKASLAATKAAEVANQASISVGGLKDSVANTAQAMKDSLASAASELREASMAKVRETLADFNSAIPVLGSMGYALSDVSIALGMPPSLQATFQISHEASEQATARAL
jgi:hypothetical protein